MFRSIHVCIYLNIFFLVFFYRFSEIKIYIYQAQSTIRVSRHYDTLIKHNEQCKLADIMYMIFHAPCDTIMLMEDVYLLIFQGIRCC